jgi:glycosyltransferase involved in cell wall biosynthesis
MGGAEVQVCTLAAGLVRRGATVQIISMMDAIANHPQLSTGSIPVRTLGMKRGHWKPGDLLHYIKLVRAYRPDIVHAQLFHATLLARLGRPFTSAPLVCTAQASIEGPERAKNAPIRTRLREVVYRLTDPLCNLTTQVSVEGAERYVAVGATPASKMLFVPNAIDSERFRPAPALRSQLRDELGLGEVFTWLWIARMEEQKDPWTLLEAFRLALHTRPCVLVAVGVGRLDKEIRQRAAALGLTSKVHFLGLRSDIPALLNAADGFVLSSSYEGLPMVLLEAACTGLPLVVTSAGAEAVAADKSGWVVKTRDPQALAERMCALMDLPVEKRRAMGEAGRDFVTAKYGLDSVLDTWEGIYTSLLRIGHRVHQERASPNS